jgi:hypothetical protein
MSYISGSISFCGNSVNCSTQTGQINGIACFWDSSSNCGIALLGEFYSGSINLGTIYEAAFSDSSTNNGVILEQVDFFENAINNNCVCGTARFYDNSSNSSSGQLAEAAVFCDGAVNCGTIIGEACFYGTSSNSGVVTVAYFNESASNLGTISGSGLFFGTSVNSGIISGDAVFADTTVNNGTVEGSGSFATGASNQGGTVNGGSGIYTPPSSGLWYADTSSVARALTLNGAITQSDEGSGVIAANFDGGNNYITTVATGSEFDFTSGDVTIEFWFKPASTAFQYLLLGIGTLAVHLWPGNQMTVNDGSNADDYFNVLLDAWQHLAIVISNGSRYVYLNGYLVATSTQLLGVTSTLYIGSENGYNGSANYNGKIAGLRIVKGTAIYTSDFALSTALLTAVSGTELLLNFGATVAPYVPIKSGAYSDGYFLNNFIDTSYFTSTPVTTLDTCNCVIYQAGAAYCVTGLDYVLDDNCYYYNDWCANLGTCYALKEYFSCREKKSIFMCEISPPHPICNVYLGNFVTPNSSWGIFQYENCSFFISCTDQSNYFIVNTSCNCTTPFDVNLGTENYPRIYFTFCGGSGIVPNGAYSNFYFSNSIGINSGFCCNTPIQAQDNYCYYNYFEGSAIIACGPYSNGYFCAGCIPSCNVATPIQPNDSCLYYVYCNGSANTAQGLYSTFAFDAGTICSAYTCLLPTNCINDSSCYYVYESGSGYLADGFYSNGKYINGCIGSFQSANCITAAIDDSKFYCYAGENYATAYIVTGYRNDVCGYDASASGIYNWGETGEYNPIPCFVVLGAFTNCYYTISGENENYYIHAGNVLDCCAAGGWIYGSNGCGIDPASVGFTNVISNGYCVWVSDVATCSCCSCTYSQYLMTSYSCCNYPSSTLILINNSGITGIGAGNVSPLNLDIILCQCYCNVASCSCYLYDEYSQCTGICNYDIADYAQSCTSFYFSNGVPQSFCYIACCFVNGVCCSGYNYSCCYIYDASAFWSMWSGFRGCANFI